MVIEVAVVPVRNGDIPLHVGDVFRTAYDVRYEGEGLKRFENPPIYENEIEIDLFIEAIESYGCWIETLTEGHTAVIHVLGENAKEIVATKMNLKTRTRGQFVSIG